jgi:hypothetical protein
MLRPALTLLSAGLLSAMLVTGCGVTFDDGPAVSSTRSVPAFERVAVDGSTDVDVRLGDHASVVVRGGKKAVSQVRTQVQDGTLVVDRHGGDGTLALGGPHLHVDVVVPRLTGARVNGSGDLDLDLRGGAFDVTVEGSGDVTARGRLDRMHAVVDGSGDIDLQELRVGALDATIEGSGDIDYAGRPELRTRGDGSGEVSRAD